LSCFSGDVALASSDFALNRPGKTKEVIRKRRVEIIKKGFMA
jgi:hypothetical protein